MKKLILIILLICINLASCKPVKKEPGMTKAELIDAIAAGSKMTKADAGFQLD